MAEDVVFAARSKSKKKVRLIKAVWLGKILRDHPELGARKEFVSEVKKAVEDPDFIVSGWFGECLALRFCELAPQRPKILVCCLP